MTFCGCVLKPGKKERVNVPDGEVWHLSQVCVHDPKPGKNYVQVEVKGTAYTLVCLEKDKVEHNSLDLFFGPEDAVFSTSGKSEVHLLGYLEPMDDGGDMSGDDEDEEEEEMPEDLAHLSPHEQMVRVVFRSVWMMTLGTVLVLAFSDPMVDCLSEWGNRLGISAFYISFVLAPFASNASELLSAYTYARKKTEKNLTTSLSTLIGAACMNNTFVLAIFLALIYLQGLAWQFTAETIAMVLIQWIIGAAAICSRTQGMVSATLILLCYPGCLFTVWFLENKVGLD
mmetsp:Transcript_102022/g.200086  ORF Transcript_102022/g.200086 Transcript_102022/m.200086 type:complete len:285 (-) Transcript_102022:158-1012(-)